MWCVLAYKSILYYSAYIPSSLRNFPVQVINSHKYECTLSVGRTITIIIIITVSNVWPPGKRSEVCLSRLG